MAGIALGAHAPDSLSHSQPTADRHAPHLVPTSTRTRRNHGVFTLGGHLACIYSTRRVGACYGVSFELGAGTLTLAGAMTPNQARGIAQALMAAANAADARQGGAA